MSEAIKKAMQMAKEVADSQAAAAAEQQSATVHHLPANQNNTSMPATPAAKFTMNDMAGGALAVDEWIKVTEDGLKIGDSGLISNLVVSLEMTDGRGFVPKMSIKAGNPAQYFSTYDGAVAIGGGTWDTAVKRALAISPTAREYRCVDLPFRLEAEAVDMKKTAFAAGKALGYTTSTTNWANWQKLYNEVEAAGLMGKRVKLNLTAQPRANKAGNKWGVIAFELLGELEEDGE